ncbi:hypothetical protein DICVIV_01005 [Dictyocaulus viviparus]|uniref:Uncharacterized protein n=1 Tax=Dictyocaulus viviparus TaxID=29172 RepID=A0A0D8Y7I4_DICVI|nr:hypothetical protein DICVIV_01005 [Dictyocaulus viviparus]
MRMLIVMLCIVTLSTQWIIYRRNHKRKLVCKEDTSLSNTTSLEEILEDAPSMNISRRRRDIEVDPVYTEPIIFIGNNNSLNYMDDGDFDVIAEHLTPEEIVEVKRQIVKTCKALKIT